MNEGSIRTQWFEYSGEWKSMESDVIEEALIAIYVNGREIVSVMCTPIDLSDLAIGFLANERVIDNLGEVDHCYVSKNECCVDVWLTREFRGLNRRIITSGCGRSTTFHDPALGIEPLEDESFLEPDRIFTMFTQLQSSESLYARARGVHSAGLFDCDRLVWKAEDVGRHNTIDKLRGACLRLDQDPKGLILLASGRISSEMLHKCALMRCPIVASRTSPTTLSIAMAKAWKITLVGYVRGRSLRVYTHPWRLGLNEDDTSNSIVGR